MNKFENREIEVVFTAIKDFLDFEPENYKEKPLLRRIRYRMRKVGVENWEDYAELIKTNDGERENLKKALTINITSFFRDKSVFETLKSKILPSIKEPSIWSAGCANGAEPYAIAILCKELNLKCSILGTDIDEDSIEMARKGEYEEIELFELPINYKIKYFEKIEGKYRIIPEIKSLVEYQVLDLKDADFENKFDLVVCRNVLIYLKKEFQEKILLTFWKALRGDGFLVLGKVEMLPERLRGFFHTVDLRDRIYVKGKGIVS
ncbi:MAG: protein-glutamate O-methyltransferase CheR [candidate division WOR-3 bacterium]